MSPSWNPKNREGPQGWVYVWKCRNGGALRKPGTRRQNTGTQRELCWALASATLSPQVRFYFFVCLGLACCGFFTTLAVYLLACTFTEKHLLRYYMAAFFGLVGMWQPERRVGALQGLRAGSETSRQIHGASQMYCRTLKLRWGKIQVRRKGEAQGGLFNKVAL